MVWLLKSVMCDMMPPAAGLPGVADTEIDAFLAKVRAETTALVWLGLCAGAALYALTPLLTVGRPLPSFLLSPEKREQHADRITSTKIYLLRQSVFLVKMYACMCWGQHASIRRSMALAPYPLDPGTFRTH
jgi:hypothetical protein